MNKIWDRKSFGVGGHCPLWRGWKNEWARRSDNKLNTKNIEFSTDLTSNFTEKLLRSKYFINVYNVYVLVTLKFICWWKPENEIHVSPVDEQIWINSHKHLTVNPLFTLKPTDFTYVFKSLRYALYTLFSLNEFRF